VHGSAWTNAVCEEDSSDKTKASGQTNDSESFTIVASVDGSSNNVLTCTITETATTASWTAVEDGGSGEEE
jgi:hypothetical protein